MTWQETVELIKSDCERLNSYAQNQRPLTTLRYLSLVFRPEVLALALYRFSHALHRRNWRRLAQWCYWSNLVLTGADIHPVSKIGKNCLLVHTVGACILGSLGEDVTIYPRVVIAPFRPNAPLDTAPIIGDRVTLSTGVTVIGPVRIADDVSVTPYSVVEKDLAVGESVVTVATPMLTRRGIS